MVLALAHPNPWSSFYPGEMGEHTEAFFSGAGACRRFGGERAGGLDLSMLPSFFALTLITPPHSMPPVAVHRSAALTFAPASRTVLRVFPTTTVAGLGPSTIGLGVPRANRANPANGGNAEGNWWTPSSALDTDCDGNPVTATTKLSRDCIYQKKVAEIRDRQAISQENAGYKVERLEQISVRAERKAAEKAARAAADKARFDKYAQRR